MYKSIKVCLVPLNKDIKIIKTLITTTILFSVISLTSNAATLHYDELIDGDIDNITYPNPTFELDIGANVIIGSISSSNDNYYKIDFDSFNASFFETVFVENIEITSIGTNGNTDHLPWAFSAYIDSYEFRINTYTGGDFNLIIGHNTDSLTNVGFYGLFNNATSDYQITINVSEEQPGAPPVPSPSNVPVPASIWLFTTGLIALIGAAKRKYS